MLNIRDELKQDIKDFFNSINTSFYLKDYNDTPENMIYFIQDNCSLYRPWSGDLWHDKNESIFSNVIFDKFATKYKNGYKLVFSEEKYRQLLKNEDMQYIFPVVACCDDTIAPQFVAYWYGVDDYAICFYSGKLQDYKVHTTPAGRNYIRTKYRCYYLDTYIKL